MSRTALLLLAAVAMTGCATTVPVQVVDLEVHLAPLVLGPGMDLNATGIVTNGGPDAVVVGGACSSTVDVRIVAPNGSRVGANATGCRDATVENVLPAGSEARHDVAWPARFWVNHVALPPGEYTVEATTMWHPPGEPALGTPLLARGTFRWTGQDEPRE